MTRLHKMNTEDINILCRNLKDSNEPIRFNGVLAHVFWSRIDTTKLVTITEIKELEHCFRKGGFLFSAHNEESAMIFDTEFKEFMRKFKSGYRMRSELITDEELSCSLDLTNQCDLNSDQSVKLKLDKWINKLKSFFKK